MSNHRGFFGNDGSLNVQSWARLNGFDLFEELRIAKVTGVLVGTLGGIPKGQNVFAKMVGHCSVSVVGTVVQQVLQKGFVPSTHVICVENIGAVRKGVPATIVGHDAEKQFNPRNLYGVRGGTISVVGVGDMGGMPRRAIHRNTIPAIGHAHRDLQFVALGGRKESAFGVAIVGFTRLFVDAFRNGHRVGRIETTNHLESIGKGSGFSSVPDIIGTGLGHYVTGVGAGILVVFVNGGMPVHGFVFLDVSRVFAGRSISQTSMEFEGIVDVVSSWIHARLGAIKGVNVVARAIVAQNGVDASVSDGKADNESKDENKIVL